MDSIHVPLLDDKSQEQELRISANIEPSEQDFSGRFGGGINFNNSQEPAKSDVYTSARLAAAGIPDPLEFDPLALPIMAINAGETMKGNYGAYNDSPPLHRPGRGSASSQGSTMSDDFVVYKHDKRRTKHEDAALYVREGEDNDNFYHHPRGKWSKRAFHALHSTGYHIFNLVVCTLLLLLAVMEQPYVGDEAQLPMETQTVILVIHTLLEICLLSILWADMIMRFFWFRPRHFFTHKRTLLILVVLVVMTIEAVVVLGRMENHIRVTRALRPIFLIDTYFLGGVRRVVRQIFLCIKPILDVLLLLLLALVVFSLMAYLYFAEIDQYFSSYKASLVSFFITLTTANDPNVLLEAYMRQPISPLFFIIYLIIQVYFISNVLLAVVYSSFSEADKNKFRKLFLHKRDALRHAYKKLAVKDEPDSDERLEFHDFLLFMHHYRPRAPEWQVMCMFKALQRDPAKEHDFLSLEEFYGFYEVLGFTWKRVTADGEEVTWFAHLPRAVKVPAHFVHTLVTNRWFNIVNNLILVVNLIFLVVYTLLIPEDKANYRFHALNQVVAVSLVFVSIYSIEICLRIFGLGFFNYFRKLRNIIDAVIIFTSLLLLILEAASPAHAVLAAFRPIKFLRLIRLKQRYRDIMNTLVVLSQRLLSVAILLLVVYYSFAIIGMEFLSNAVFENCCNDSMYNVGIFYSGTNGTFTPNVYYLLNFDNIFRSYFTLFVLMVVNNWYVIMEGFTSTSPYHWLVRLYFMSFYIVTLVVLQVVISFIVEAFVFQFQIREKARICTKHPKTNCNCYKALSQRKKKININLQPGDIEKLKYEIAYNDETGGGVKTISHMIRLLKRVNFKKMKEGPTVQVTYRGRRLRTKDDIHLLMHRADLTGWVQERDKELKMDKDDSSKQPVWKTIWDHFVSFVQFVIE